MTVPLFTLVAGVILWCAWLTREIYKSQKDIAVNTSNDEAVKNQITEVKNQITGVKTDMGVRIDRFETHVNKQFDKVFSKLDQLKL